VSISITIEARDLVVLTCQIAAHYLEDSKGSPCRRRAQSPVWHFPLLSN
jgi:hypothetical protein